MDGTEMGFGFEAVRYTFRLDSIAVMCKFTFIVH